MTWLQRMPEEGSIGLLKGYEEVDMHIWAVRPTVRVGRSAPVDGNKLTHNLKIRLQKRQVFVELLGI